LTRIQPPKAWRLAVQLAGGGAVMTEHVIAAAGSLMLSGGGPQDEASGTFRSQLYSLLARENKRMNAFLRRGNLEKALIVLARMQLLAERYGIEPTPSSPGTEE
jgi:hypothetical protein